MYILDICCSELSAGEKRGGGGGVGVNVMLEKPITQKYGLIVNLK